jgi:hypothetical protein
MYQFQPPSVFGPDERARVSSSLAVTTMSCTHKAMNDYHKAESYIMLALDQLYTELSYTIMRG